jgi:hypothetical protein
MHVNGGTIIRGDHMGETVAGGEKAQIPKEIKLVSKAAPDYRLEFINGAICNITARGEIVCDFHLESRERPVEQVLKVAEDGTVIAANFVEIGNYTREVKFGIVMNASFAKDLIKLLDEKMKEAEEALADRAKERA